MITAFMSANAQQLNELHAVHVIQREGMTKIRAKGFCAAEGNAGPGVYQVPDWAFDGRAKYGEIAVCPKCAQTAIMMKNPPR